MQKFTVAHSPAAFIPALPIKHLSLSEVLSGMSLKQAQQAQLQRYAGPAVVSHAPAHGHATSGQSHPATPAPIPLQSTAHTVAPPYPVITHPLRALEGHVAFSLMVVVALYSVYAFFADNKRDKQIQY